MKNLVRNRFLLLAFGVFVPLLLSVGCGTAQPDNIVHVIGLVTHKGKPLPVGMIVFEPNPAKENSGPQGHADIKDGKFDTRASKKGAAIGPMIVRITGGDGIAPEPFTPFGKLLSWGQMLWGRTLICIQPRLKISSLARFNRSPLVLYDSKLKGLPQFPPNLLTPASNAYTCSATKKTH